MKKRENELRSIISAIWREKALITMMHHGRGNVYMHNAQVLTRDEMDRVLLRPVL